MTMQQSVASLEHEPVRRALDRITREQRRIDAVEEPKLLRLIKERAAPLMPEDVIDACRLGYFTSPEVIGRMLYSTVRAIRPQTVVEFGTSHGFSTIHIAAALRDNGGGVVITSELDSRKLRDAAWNFAAAGLTEHIQVLPGEAGATLATVAGPIDLVYLDAWAGSYLPVLEKIEPALRPGALVYAHGTSRFAEDARSYLCHVRAPQNGYLSVEIPLGHGLEMSTRAGASSASAVWSRPLGTSCRETITRKHSGGVR
jgi:predicted O-methyltransferase YrrM